MFRKAILIVGLMTLCGGVALAVQYVYDDLAVVGSGGTARIYIQQYDPLFGVPWTALKDRGGVPAELEIAPVPGQYDQATVKTWLAVLGKGLYTPGDEVATAPFDARLLMSGPWPYSYVALRDDGGSPATLEMNPLHEYRDIDAMIQNNGEFRVTDADNNDLFALGGGGGGVFTIDSTSGKAVEGKATAASGVTYAGYFQNDSASGLGVAGMGGGSGGTFVCDGTSGYGVVGRATSLTGTTYGGDFQSDSTSGTGVRGRASSATGTTYGVYGQSDSPDGAGVYGDGGATGGAFTTSSTSGIGADGYASAASGTTYGGNFTSDSTSGTGVSGYATAASGTTYGVYGRTDSASGAGVYGQGSARGVEGLATAGTGNTRGGYFHSDSTSGRGLVAWAAAATGTTYGVYGQVTSSDGFAGYFVGGNGVYTDDIEWATKTGYIKVNPAEYVPSTTGYNYDRTAFEVSMLTGGATVQDWYAPLQLPHGSTITSVEWHWYDLDVDEDLHFYMYEVDGSSIVNTMATGASSGSAGYGSTSTTSITSPIVDNTQYSYAIKAVMESPLFFHGICHVNIHYTYTKPY